MKIQKAHKQKTLKQNNVSQDSENIFETMKKEVGEPAKGKNMLKSTTNSKGKENQLKKGGEKSKCVVDFEFKTNKPNQAHKAEQSNHSLKNVIMKRKKVSVEKFIEASKPLTDIISNSDGNGNGINGKKSLSRVAHNSADYAQSITERNLKLLEEFQARNKKYVPETDQQWIPGQNLDQAGSSKMFHNEGSRLVQNNGPPNQQWIPDNHQKFGQNLDHGGSSKVLQNEGSRLVQDNDNQARLQRSDTPEDLSIEKSNSSNTDHFDMTHASSNNSQAEGLAPDHEQSSVSSSSNPEMSVFDPNNSLRSKETDPETFRISSDSDILVIDSEPTDSSNHATLDTFASKSNISQMSENPRLQDSTNIYELNPESMNEFSDEHDDDFFQASIQNVNSEETRTCTYDHICKKCRASFRTDLRLRVHRESCLTERSPTECQHCFKGFKSPLSQFNHVIFAHYNIYKYRCKYCKKAFQQPYLLRTHEVKNLCQNDDSENLSEDASKSQDSKNQSKYNSKLGLLEKKKGLLKFEETFSCTKCKTAFQSGLRLQIHQDGCLNGKSELQCPYCISVYKAKDKVYNHVLFTHLKTFRFTCPNCKKSFAENTYLKTHMKNKVCEKVKKNLDLTVSTLERTVINFKHSQFKDHRYVKVRYGKGVRDDHHDVKSLNTEHSGDENEPIDTNFEPSNQNGYDTTSSFETKEKSFQESLENVPFHQDIEQNNKVSNNINAFPTEDSKDMQPINQQKSASFSMEQILGQYFNVFQTEKRISNADENVKVETLNTDTVDINIEEIAQMRDRIDHSEAIEQLNIIPNEPQTVEIHEELNTQNDEIHEYQEILTNEQEIRNETNNVYNVINNDHEIIEDQSWNGVLDLSKEQTSNEVLNLSNGQASNIGNAENEIIEDQSWNEVLDLPKEETSNEVLNLSKIQASYIDNSENEMTEDQSWNEVLDLSKGSTSNVFEGNLLDIKTEIAEIDNVMLSVSENEVGSSVNEIKVQNIENGCAEDESINAIIDENEKETSNDYKKSISEKDFELNATESELQPKKVDLVPLSEIQTTEKINFKRLSTESDESKCIIKQTDDFFKVENLPKNVIQEIDSVNEPIKEKATLVAKIIENETDIVMDDLENFGKNVITSSPCKKMSICKNVDNEDVTDIAERLTNEKSKNMIKNDLSKSSEIVKYRNDSENDNTDLKTVNFPENEEKCEPFIPKNNIEAVQNSTTVEKLNQSKQHLHEVTEIDYLTQQRIKRDTILKQKRHLEVAKYVKMTTEPEKNKSSILIRKKYQIEPLMEVSKAANNVKAMPNLQEKPMNRNRENKPPKKKKMKMSCFVCNICYSLFGSRNRLNEHVENFH